MQVDDHAVVPLRAHRGKAGGGGVRCREGAVVFGLQVYGLADASLVAGLAARGAAVEPVRVYVGLRSADTPEIRAKLALEELKRVGGFEPPR